MFKNLKLGERICALRQGREMTQKDLAKQMNVSDKTISKWETSENEPGISDIQKLTDIFGVSLDLILRGEAVGKGDNDVLKGIKQLKELNEAKQEIVSFFKKECPYKEISSDDLFMVIDNKPYAILSSILLIDDFEFFNKVNERFVFVRALETKEGNSTGSVLDRGYSRDKNKSVFLPHPYTLTLKDLKNNNSLEFFEFVINKMKSEIEKENENNEKLRKMGYGIGLRKQSSVEEQLSEYLENLEIYDIEDDSVYEKIIFLIENGAVFYSRVPYNSDSGGYQTFVDTARTDFTYKICVDHIKFINKLAELEEDMKKLKK